MAAIPGNHSFIEWLIPRSTSCPYTWPAQAASQAAVAFNENALLLTLHSADASYIICILEREKNN